MPENSVNQSLPWGSPEPQSKPTRGSLLSLGRDQLFGPAKPKSNRLNTFEADEKSQSPQTPTKLPEEPKKLTQTLDSAYQRYLRNGTPADLNAVVHAASPVLERAAITYAGGFSPLIRSRARIIAAQAVRGYDPTKQTSLKTWLMSHLQGLTRYRQQLSPIRTPERVAYELGTLLNVKQELADELGRDPRDEELSQRSGLSMKRLRHIRQYNRPVKAESELVDEEGASYLPGVPSNSPDQLWAEMVYHDLEPVNKQIYDMLLGRNGQPAMSVNDAAKKLGVSAAAVSQRAAKIAHMLEEGSKLKGQY